MPAPDVHYEVYKDEADQWRWRLKHRNGDIMADSGQGYSEKADCLHGIDVVKQSANAPVKVETAAERLNRVLSKLSDNLSGKL